MSTDARREAVDALCVAVVTIADVYAADPARGQDWMRDAMRGAIQAAVDDALLTEAERPRESPSLTDSVGRPLSSSMMKEAQRLWAACEEEAERRAIKAEMGVGEWEAFVYAIVDRMIEPPVGSQDERVIGTVTPEDAKAMTPIDAAWVKHPKAVTIWGTGCADPKHERTFEVVLRPVGSHSRGSGEDELRRAAQSAFALLQDLRCEVDGDAHLDDQYEAIEPVLLELQHAGIFSEIEAYPRAHLRTEGGPA